MGEDSVVSGINVQTDVVNARVRALNSMFDQLESGVRGVNGIQGLQTTRTWTDIPACAQFAATYEQALDALGGRLETVWTRIEQQALALRDAAQALAGTDEQSQDDLDRARRAVDALVVRAEAGPTTRLTPAPGTMRAV